MPEASIWIFFGQYFLFFENFILYIWTYSHHLLNASCNHLLCSPSFPVLSRSSLSLFNLCWVQFVMPSCPGMGLTCEVTALQTSGIPSSSGPQMPLETLVLASVCLCLLSQCLWVHVYNCPVVLGKQKQFPWYHPQSVSSLSDPDLWRPRAQSAVSVRCGVHTWSQLLGEPGGWRPGHPHWCVGASSRDRDQSVSGLSEDALLTVLRSSLTSYRAGSSSLCGLSASIAGSPGCPGWCKLCLELAGVDWAVPFSSGQFLLVWGKVCWLRLTLASRWQGLDHHTGSVSWVLGLWVMSPRLASSWPGQTLLRAAIGTSGSSYEVFCHLCVCNVLFLLEIDFM